MKRKNVVVAVLLGLFLGPCGFVYVNGGLAVLAIGVTLLMVYASKGALFAWCWLGSAVGTGVAAASRNATLDAQEARVEPPVPAARRAPTATLAAAPAAPPRPVRSGPAARRCDSCGVGLAREDRVCGVCGCVVEEVPRAARPLAAASAGVGAEMRLEDAGLRLLTVFPGSGAAQAGLAAGDCIVAVEGQEVTRLGQDSALDRLRGPEGTCVLLVVNQVEKHQTGPVAVVRRALSP